MQSPQEKSSRLGFGLSKMQKYFKTVSVSNLKRPLSLRPRQEFRSMKQTPKIDLKELIQPNWDSVIEPKRSIRKIQIIQKPKHFMQNHNSKNTPNMHTSLHFPESDLRQKSNYHPNQSELHTRNNKQSKTEQTVEPRFEYGRSKSFRTKIAAAQRSRERSDKIQDGDEVGLGEWGNVKSQFDHRSFGRSLSKKEWAIDAKKSRSRDKLTRIGLKANKDKQPVRLEPLVPIKQERGQVQITESGMLKRNTGTSGKGNNQERAHMHGHSQQSDSETYSSTDSEQDISDNKELQQDQPSDKKNVFFMDPLGGDTKDENNFERRPVVKSNITSLTGKVEEPMFLMEVNSFRNIGMLQSGLSKQGKVNSTLQLPL